MRKIVLHTLDNYIILQTSDNYICLMNNTLKCNYSTLNTNAL